MSEGAKDIPPGLFPPVFAGIAAGGAGTLAGYWAVRLARRWTGDSDIWLKGAHGPPFFDLALATAVYYAALGAGLRRGGPRERARAAWPGFWPFFAAFSMPMALATRLFDWGEAPGAQPTYAWIYAVLGTYAAANGVAAFEAGRRAGAGARSGLGGLLGGGVAFAAVAGLQQTGFFGPAQAAAGALPPFSNLMSGALWGALIGAGTALARKGDGALLSAA